MKLKLCINIFDIMFFIVVAHVFSLLWQLKVYVGFDLYQSLNRLLEIHKIAVCFLWLSLPDHYRVTDEALLAETT